MSARVLVVDDLLPNVKLLEAKLTREYYEVITASDGFQALDAMKKSSPDIVLLDVMMPGMDGFETCRRIREDASIAHIPVVMVTALSEKNDRIHGLEVGADDFLTKPVNDIALFARVKSLVRLKVMMDELRLRGQTGIEFGLENLMSEKLSASKANILIVDDDVVQARQISEKLSTMGNKITVLSDGAKALEGAKSGGYELIIISTHMNDMDGLRLCSQLRSYDETRNVSILILIDEEDINLLVKGLDIGINDYLVTPIDVNELVARVKTQVRRKRYQDALRTNYKQSISMAVTDGLTGLYNRRYMDSYLANTISDSIKSHKPLSMMLLDIDHFKSVNDTYGHNVGDEVIKQFAKHILSSIRTADLAARYGGEEFVVIMPGTELAGAVEVAERMRAQIENTPFLVSTEEGKLTKTVSIGVAAMKEDGDSAEAFLKRCDEALYQAKNSGRNRVVSAGGASAQ